MNQVLQPYEAHIPYVLQVCLSSLVFVYLTGCSVVSLGNRHFNVMEWTIVYIYILCLYSITCLFLLLKLKLFAA